MSREFANHISDLLSPLGPVTAKGMFGGFGIYLDGLMFGLIAHDVVYFKADSLSKAPYEAAGMSPFKPWEHKPMTMPYWEVPADVLDDEDDVRAWGRAAFEAALRNRKAKKPKKPKKS